MTEVLTLAVHASQFPEAVQQNLQDALSAGVLPARFLYDSPAQASRWLSYHAAWSPSRTDTVLTELYDKVYRDLLDELPAHFGYVSLGCGGGRKDARFLALAQEDGRTVRPTLTDTSPSLVTGAMLKSPRAAGLVVDLEAAPPRTVFAPSDEITAWTAFGMVPNLDSGRFLRWLAENMGPKDRALISANLHPKPYPEATADILPQYDNPPARAWYAGALDELGLSGADIQVTAELAPNEDDQGRWRVVVRARWPYPAEARVFDKMIGIEGNALQLFFSNRFTPEAFDQALKEAGLSVARRRLFEGEEEGVWLVSRGSRPR